MQLFGSWLGMGGRGDNSEPKLQGLPTSFLAERRAAETEPWNIIIWEEEIGAQLKQENQRQQQKNMVENLQGESIFTEEAAYFFVVILEALEDQQLRDDEENLGVTLFELLSELLVLFGGRFDHL